MKIRTSILALLVMLACYCGAQALGPAKDPAPVDPSAAVNAVNQLATSANATIAAQAQQLQAAKAAAQQLQTVNALPWMWVNDEENDYWGVCRWADAMKCSSGFSFSAGTANYSSDGYPIGANIKATAQVWMVGCPAGVYQFSFAGTGVASVSVMGGTYLATAQNTGTVTLAQAGTLVNNQWGTNQPNVVVLITVTSGSASDPIRDMHLWLPGYGPGTAKASQVYRDEYLALFKGACAARVMPSLLVNPSTETDWSTRLNPTNVNQTARGVAHEWEIELAKEAGLKGLWINVPPHATADYITNCAKLYHDGLPPGVKLVAEWCNEPWNWGFPIRNSLDAETKATPATVNGSGAPASGDPNILDARDAAEHARTVANIFRQVYADRPGDLLTAIGGQSGDPAWIDNGLGWLVAKYGSHPFNLIAIAPYYGYEDQSASVDALFAAMNTYFADTTQKGNGVIPGLGWQVLQHQQLAKKYGAQLADYEGGQSFPVDLNADGSVNANGVHTLAQTDPRMGLLTDQYYAALHKYGVAFHCEFCLIGEPWSKYGYWSLLRNFGDSTPRFDSVQRESLRSN